MTGWFWFHDIGTVLAITPERPYFDAWLRRAGKQLATSGKLSQIAVVLAAENGGSNDEWRARLLTLLRGDDTPSIELLTRIDALLAGSHKNKPANDSLQGLLF